MHKKVDGNDENTDPMNEKKYAILKIPYLGKISTTFGNKIKKLLSTEDFNIRIVYNTTKVQQSFQLKDPIPNQLRSRVVYKFSCRGDPSISYIGFTNRTLQQRSNEHLRGGTAVSDHIGNCQTCQNSAITVIDFKIIKKCKQKYEAPIFEALFIKEQDPILNRQLVKPGGKQFTLDIFD